MTETYHPQSSDELKEELAKGYACTQKELDRLWKEVDEIEDQEDLRLVMERRNGPTTRLTLEELSVLPTQENNS